MHGIKPHNWQKWFDKTVCKLKTYLKMHLNCKTDIERYCTFNTD